MLPTRKSVPRSSRQSTTRIPPNHHKKTQTAVIWSCLPFIKSSQNHLARRSERGKKTRQTEEEVGSPHQGMDRPGVRQVPEGNGEQGKMEEIGCEIICGAPTTLAVKGLMMMMMMILWQWRHEHAVSSCARCQRGGACERATQDTCGS